jgi:hypothetical protein
MSAQCIHGFPTQQCIACRTCQHGQVTSTCTRCRAPVTTRQVAAAAAAAPVPATEAHGDYEVFYEPEVSGWRYRSAESEASRLSYRSAFLARKAIDQLAAEPAPKAKARGKGTKAAG